MTCGKPGACCPWIFPALRAAGDDGADVRRTQKGPDRSPSAEADAERLEQPQQRHAEEEFAVKRLELDLDRASWVVELAMEWSKEKHGQELPPAIVSELTKNLFNDRDAAKGTRSKADLFENLLGASSEAEIDAGNAKFKFNRRGAARLKDTLKDDE